MGRISKCLPYVVDVNELDPLSIGELWGGVQCFGEFGPSRLAKTVKIGRRVRDRHKLT